MKERIKRLFSFIRDADVVLVKNSYLNPSFFYITGLPREFYEGAVALAWRDGHIDAVVSQLEEERSMHVDFHRVKNRREMKETLIKLTEKTDLIGFDGMHTFYSDYKVIRRILKGKRFRDVGKEILKVRLIKEKNEIEQIERACRIASRVSAEIPEMLEKGTTEKEVANKIVNRMRQHGARREAFETIVAFGENSAIPHYSHGERKLREGDIVLVDFGAVVNGYVSDISRTFVYGRASDRQRRMFEVVLRAQKMAIDSIKEGMLFESLHKKVQRHIDKTEFRGRFTHSTGHTIGIDVHDGFGISAGCKERFSSGMAFTVEPGIYIPEIGGVRIEDDVVIEKGKVKILTTAPKVFEI